jgi:hypothetical protein
MQGKLQDRRKVRTGRHDNREIIGKKGRQWNLTKENDWERCADKRTTNSSLAVETWHESFSNLRAIRFEAIEIHIREMIVPKLLQSWSTSNSDLHSNSWSSYNFFICLVCEGIRGACDLRSYFDLTSIKLINRVIESAETFGDPTSFHFVLLRSTSFYFVPFRLREAEREEDHVTLKKSELSANLFVAPIPCS